MRLFPGVIVVVLCLLVTGVRGQSYAETNDTINERVFYFTDLEHVIDTTNKLSIADVSTSSFAHNFRRRETYQNKDFLPGASYWIRFPVRNKVSSAKDWLVEFYDQTIDVIEVYAPSSDGSYNRKVMGDHYPFFQRTFKHKNFEVRLDAPDIDTTLVYYFRIQSHDFADIRIAFKSVDRFIYYVLNEYFLYGTFYGMILIISLYNFLVYLAIREIKNVYYIIYILSVALYTLSIDGIGFQYIWPAHPGWNDYMGGIALYLVILWATIFTRRFLNTSRNSYHLDQALKWMIAARTLLFIIELFFFPQFFAYRTVEIIPLSMIFYTGIRVWYKGYRPARFFVLAYGILFFGFFMRALVYFDLIPLTTLSHYSLHISFVLEMLFLTFALGDRIRILKNMRDRALKRIIHQHEVNMQLKDKVNRELEHKVKERTLELDEKNIALVESNRKLEQQANEINQINSMLDLDNWKLKNSIKEVLNERLSEKAMDYKQFRTLYPDNLSCFRFLESLKWEHGFLCRKCGNSKHFDGARKFARRCTRCGYNESITAYTIFHGVKFPIEKAFYIAYLTVTEKKDYTLEVLATELNIRLSTVWSFKHKVMERLEDLDKKGCKPHVSRWEDVIMVDTHRGKSSRSAKYMKHNEPS